MKPTALAAITLFACIAAFVIPVRAAEPLAPAAQPAAQAGEIDALVNQLGEDDFHIRLSAAQKLKAMGPVVIPAVRKAIASEDPEIHARAEDILDDIEHPQDLLPQPTGFGEPQIRITVVNGLKIVDVRETGRTIHIQLGVDGISMKVAGRLDGRYVIREFKTRTVEQLKKENPEAFELFQRYAANGNALRFGFQANGLRIQGNANVRLNGVFVVPAVARRVAPQPLLPLVRMNPAGDDLDGLENKVVDQMKARKLPEVEQEDVKGLLKHLREGLPLNNVDPDAAIRDYDRRCDALRKKLADLNLADPGDALPPPASSRLGISVAPEPIQGQGLVITHIQAGSRAVKLGLKEDDIIQKINDKDIHTTAELRKAVTDNPAGLVVKGLRDGQPFEKHEMGEAPVSAKR